MSFIAWEQVCMLWAGVQLFALRRMKEKIVLVKMCKMESPFFVLMCGTFILP